MVLGRDRARTSQLDLETVSIALRDDEIVQIALERPDEFRLLYERYAERIFWYALSRTRSVSDADDIVSDTMLAAFEKLHLFNPDRGSFAQWIFTIASRKATDNRRYHQRLWQLITRQAHRVELNQEVEAYERLFHDEQMAAVYDALKTLSTADQEIISLRFAAGLPTIEISEVLGISHGATRMRLSRATRRLAGKLGGKGVDR